ncbi:MAG: hypothetical protein M1823_006693, partial [Watsoniomyces obsoletus]
GGWPVIVNAFDIPKSHAWLKFKEWADEYGPFYQVNAFGTTLVVISKASIANEFLGLRGSIYSDRPALIMPGLITENGFLEVEPFRVDAVSLKRCSLAAHSQLHSQSLAFQSQRTV